MSSRSAAVAAAGVLALLVAAVLDVLQGQGGLSAHAVLDGLRGQGGRLEVQIVRDVRLPRAAAGIVAGGALAAAAVLLQAVTRNRLAEAGTLGLTAGGTLAVTATAAYAAGSPALTTLGAAFAGVLAGSLAVAAIAAIAGAGPVRLVLAGMATSLALAAATAAIQLLRENETGGLFLWGAGSLLQLGWGTVRVAALVAAVALVVAMFLARALDVHVLGESSARALGQRAGRVRLGAWLLASVLTASAVAVAGPIAFVGILAVFVARLGRPRRQLGLLLAAVPWGGAIVLMADVLARVVLGGDGEQPAGVVCALFGAPLLVYLARRAPAETAPSVDRAAGAARWRPWVVVAAAIVLPIAAVASLALGDVAVPPLDVARSLVGSGPPLAEIVVDLRAPRLCVALLAGGMLAAAGTILQAVVRNPLASPELVGVTGGASVGALVVLLAVAAAPAAVLPFAAFVGGMLALTAVLLLAGARGASPPRLALIGLAVTAGCTAVSATLILRAEPAASVAVAWLAGSTYASGWDDLRMLAVPAVVLLPIAVLAARALDTIALGDDAALSLGMRLARARAGLIALGAALAACAVAVTGAIAFVGLMAPHAARLLAGGNHRRLLPVAILLGMALLGAADAIGRTVLAPKEIPSGLVISLIGAPYLAWLLLRSRGAGA